MYPLLLLQVLHHREQVTRLGVPFRPEHTHEALARFVEDLGELFEPDRRIDIVAQHCFAGINVAGEQTLDPFGRVPVWCP